LGRRKGKAKGDQPVTGALLRRRLSNGAKRGEKRSKTV